MIHIRTVFFLLLAYSLLTPLFPQCPPYFERPVEWKDEARYSKFLLDATAALEGRRIFLDPGHGGADRRSKGKLGLVVEADINLSVALALRDFLSECRAEVIMSRTSDKTVSLAERCALANESCADIFISVHHNSPGNDEESINYTSTYYHAFETDYEYEPMERDLARFVQRDLSFAMRNSGGTGSFDGTYSDYIINPSRGFFVLRNTSIPSILVECGFFTNNFEERRLSLTEFNKVQAFGILKGLYRYFKSGAPLIRQVNTLCYADSVQLIVSVTDTTPIDPSSIIVFYDKTIHTAFSYDRHLAQITVSIPDPFSIPREIKIRCKNVKGMNSWPFTQTIQIHKE